MAVRRIVYLGILAGCLAFYMFYREWLSWILLLWVLGLPALSLLLSLPAMLSVRFRFQCPDRVVMGETVKPELLMNCKFPMPLIRCRIQVESGITGEKYLYGVGEKLLTDHCGVRHVRIWRLWVYDYMGLFRRRVRTVEACAMVVEPTPVSMEQLPQIQTQRVCAWKPKSGGGFSENHELRLYRPGDDLRQLHWKLAAKTGKLILREPMEPRQGKLVLSVVLSGSIYRIDEKLGRLLWLSQSMLKQGYAHEIQCLSGRGLETYPVSDEAQLRLAMDAILDAPATSEEASVDTADALWQYHVGGEGHEA